ncbi:hypothetical protein SDRG_02074 [Saprolegnia diclina VS20]|uniref:Major facilitator superfamily (MFS) profile domain-containing protein n=1 Tax=Saprolegnia diclina (strain VS20) TaxID=1156394 RepID=T0R252_SAPDV|nr:hypothetical protein SDRG_02074 [Saprolegnia diclina VS20]EQC41016.1 hypothetical protein SDRG_02074 [Saprolegnia diclina VS20]|eukprot:XP_008605860.1 hypothetical protein SDRG_02074 [Saprolegnia diclina VS20]
MHSARDCLRGVLLLAVAFLLVFTSYNAIENLETSILPGACLGCDAHSPLVVCQRDSVCVAKVEYACDAACAAPFVECKSTLGSTTLGVIYLCFMLSSMLGPLVPQMIGEKASLIGSSACYGVFAVANMVVAMHPAATELHPWILLPASALIGLAASVLWVSQGSYLTRLSVCYAQFKNLPDTSSMGYMNGTFSAIYKASQLTGNVLSSFILGTLQWSSATLFTTYAMLSFVGTGLLCFLEPLQKLQRLPTEGSKLLPGEEPPHSPLASMRAVWNLARDPRMVVFAPLMLFTGIQQGFTSSEFTSSFIRESLGEASIGYVMAVFGGMSVVFSYILGRVTDRVGPMWTQLVACAAQFTAYSMCLWTPMTKCDGQWTLILVCAVLLSLSEAASSTIPSVVLGQEFTANALNAFSLFRVYHSGAASLSFFGLPLLSLTGRLYVLLASTALAAASMVLYATRYRTVA